MTCIPKRKSDQRYFIAVCTDSWAVWRHRWIWRAYVWDRAMQENERGRLGRNKRGLGPLMSSLCIHRTDGRGWTDVIEMIQEGRVSRMRTAAARGGWTAGHVECRMFHLSCETLCGRERTDSFELLLSHCGRPDGIRFKYFSSFYWALRGYIFAWAAYVGFMMAATAAGCRWATGCSPPPISSFSC